MKLCIVQLIDTVLYCKQCPLHICSIKFVAGHVFDRAEAQIAQGPGEVLPVEREHGSSSHRRLQEPAVQQGVLSNAGSGKTIKN